MNPDLIFILDEYSAAHAFIRGEIEVRGDVCGAVRFFLHRHGPRAGQWWHSLQAAWALFANTFRSSREAAVRNIRFHYDLSREFYRQFLDSRMLYSAAEFGDAGGSLEQAQLRKLDRICRELDVRPQERFLDIGCGWGALVVHAAERFGAQAFGCTLSRDQLDAARGAARARGLSRRIAIEELDYRDLQGRYEKIASVGMFEHVGRTRLAGYFRKVYSLLEDGGRFLNRGIVRPQNVAVGPATLFLERRVFPGGELVHLADVIRQAEAAGFGVVSVSDLRRDYARTCRAWVGRLQHNAETCRALVGEETYRTWLLYLAASAVSFEDGTTDAAQVVFEKNRRGI